MPKQVGSKTVIVCCDRLLLTHSANFIKLTFMVVKIFLVRLFAPHRLLRPGATATLCPFPFSYATATYYVAKLLLQ